MVTDGDSNYQNNFVMTDLGIRLIPLSFKGFQMIFGFSGSFQYRQTADNLHPERKTGSSVIGEGHKPLTQSFIYSSAHVGYKFEMLTTFSLSEEFYLGPSAAIRSYPRGGFDITRSFEFGMQGGYRF